MNELTWNKHAKYRLKDDFDFKGKILEVGPLNNPFFKKEDVDVYYADIKSTEAVQKRYSGFDDEHIVPIDYVIKDSYENTFKDSGEKFDYVFLSHVLEHIPNPINFLLDISTILKPSGKICFLLPDKNYTIDHYRENSSFADWYDMYIRGEEINTPRLVLDNRLDRVNETIPSNFWNNKTIKYPHPDIKKCLNLYFDFIGDFENKSFDDHYWVFTDQSFLRILENALKLNIIPYKLIAYYPTAYNTNTFGLVLELNHTIQKDLELRRNQIRNFREISKKITEKRFEIGKFVELKNKFYNDVFDKYDTCRIDLKNIGKSNNSIDIINISDYLANFNYPSWFKDELGEGLKIESQSHALEINAKCIGDGELNISLKSLDIRNDANSKIPIYIKYNKFCINNNIIFDKQKLVWHDDSYNFKLSVKDKEIIKIYVEWEPF